MVINPGGGAGTASGLVGACTADFTTASAAYVDITGCSVTVKANKTYLFAMQFKMVGGATNSAQMLILTPALVTIQGESTRWDGATAQIVQHLETTNIIAATSVTQQWIISGSLIVGANAGTVKLQIKSLAGENVTAFRGTGIQLVESA